MDEINLPKKAPTDKECEQLMKLLENTAKSLNTHSSELRGFSYGYHVLRCALKPHGEFAVRVAGKEAEFIGGAFLALWRVLVHSQEHLNRLEALAAQDYLMCGIERLPYIEDMMEHELGTNPVPIHELPEPHNPQDKDELPF